MNEELQELESQKIESEVQKKDYTLPASILLSALVLGGAWVYTAGPKEESINNRSPQIVQEQLDDQGIEIPVQWEDLGRKMAEAGVFDRDQLVALYNSRGGLNAADVKLIDGSNDGKLRVTQANSGLLLNLLWALGLSNKNQILEKGPMMDPKYGGADRFASTGGWTLAKGSPMNHYSMHQFITLTSKEQTLVEMVAKNVYRPCCGNSTYFPDCNHGMAMLGLLELMASQGASESEMYRVALQVNSLWFPDTYQTIAKYLESKGVSWGNSDPKEILGARYSSASGYRQILSQVTPPAQKSGGSCGV